MRKKTAEKPDTTYEDSAELFLLACAALIKGGARRSTLRRRYADAVPRLRAALVGAGVSGDYVRIIQP